jgi:spermidine/putrescine transport system substrate-binding protein
MPNVQPTLRASRRKFLKAGAGLAVGLTLLPYKAGAAEEKKLNLYSWDSYLGENTLADFNKATGVTVKLDIYGSNDELFAKLKAGNPGYDVIIPSANWVQRFVKANMLVQLDHGKIPNIKNYDKSFMDGEFDPGRKYSLAYTWGTFGIGYRKSKSKTKPDSWKYLLDSTDYDGRISIQADQEYALGAALQYLGYSWNSTNAKELAKAKDLLIAAKKHIKLFAKDNGDSLLASGDVDICGEYSGDVLSQMQKDTTNDMDYTLPKEGGNKWQDTMAIAKGAPHPANAYAYINWICDAKVNAELMGAINYPTPNAAAKAIMPDDYKNNPIIFPTAEQLKKAEPSLYLGEDATSAREEIWTAVQAA